MEGWTKISDQWVCPICSQQSTWHCFECNRIVVVVPKFVTRDGGRWMQAPPDWLFVKDHDELTFVCSERCIRAIYARND